MLIMLTPRETVCRFVSFKPRHFDNCGGHVDATGLMPSNSELPTDSLNAHRPHLAPMDMVYQCWSWFLVQKNMWWCRRTLPLSFSSLLLSWPWRFAKGSAKHWMFAGWKLSIAGHVTPGRADWWAQADPMAFWPGLSNPSPVLGHALETPSASSAQAVESLSLSVVRPVLCSMTSLGWGSYPWSLWKWWTACECQRARWMQRPHYDKWERGEGVGSKMKAALVMMFWTVSTKLLLWLCFLWSLKILSLFWKSHCRLGLICWDARSITMFGLSLILFCHAALNFNRHLWNWTRQMVLWLQMGGPRLCL